MKLSYHNVRTRFTLRDNTPFGMALELPRRNTILPGSVVTGMFAIFAGALMASLQN